MTPGRGRCLVRKVETEETFQDSHIILPEAVRDTLSAQQVEMIASGPFAECRDYPDCDRPHIGMMNAPAGRFPGEPVFHPFHVEDGAWCVIARRSLVESGEPGCYLIPQDDVLAILSAD